MKRPTLTLVIHLTRPLIQAVRTLKNINSTKKDQPEIILKGLFALSISTLETAVSDTFKQFYLSFPVKLGESKKMEIPPTLLFNGGDEILEHVVNKRVDAEMKASNLKDIFESFHNVTGTKRRITEEQWNVIIEAKATRNVLLHNDLKVNERYYETAGPLVRQPYRHNKLEIRDDYMHNVVSALTALTEDYLEQIKTKFKKYTYLNALRSFWNYYIENLEFDKAWVVNEEDDYIESFNYNAYKEASLSIIESDIIGFWSEALFDSHDPIAGRSQAKVYIHIAHFEHGPITAKMKFFFENCHILFNNQFMKFLSGNGG